MSPVDFGADRETRASGVDVSPSAPISLTSLVCATCDPRPDSGVPPALIDRANAFWGDGEGMLSEELDVLADAVGLLGSADVEPLFARLLEPIVLAEPPGLETEPEEARRIVRARLVRLAGDADLRRRYVDLLRALWETFAPRWEGGLRDEADRVAAEWRRRLDAGADLFDLLPDAHIARREPYTRMAREALAEGRVLLSPTMAGLGHIIALPRRLSIAAQPAHDDPVVRRREAATLVADALKTLAEPTRLTILTQLAAHPSGVSELARTLHISQPTASVHVRKLREAGLLEATKDGAATVYTARPEVARTMLTMARNRLYGVMTGLSADEVP